MIMIAAMMLLMTMIIIIRSVEKCGLTFDKEMNKGFISLLYSLFQLALITEIILI